MITLNLNQLVALGEIAQELIEVQGGDEQVTLREAGDEIRAQTLERDYYVSPEGIS